MWGRPAPETSSVDSKAYRAVLPPRMPVPSAPLEPEMRAELERLGVSFVPVPEAGDELRQALKDRKDPQGALKRIMREARERVDSARERIVENIASLDVTDAIAGATITAASINALKAKKKPTAQERKVDSQDVLHNAVHWRLLLAESYDTQKSKGERNKLLQSAVRNVVIPYLKSAQDIETVSHALQLADPAMNALNAVVLSQRDGVVTTLADREKRALQKAAEVAIERATVVVRVNGKQKVEEINRPRRNLFMSQLREMLAPRKVAKQDKKTGETMLGKAGQEGGPVDMMEYAHLAALAQLYGAFADAIDRNKARRAGKKVDVRVNGRTSGESINASIARTRRQYAPMSVHENGRERPSANGDGVHEDGARPRNRRASAESNGDELNSAILHVHGKNRATITADQIKRWNEKMHNFSLKELKAKGCEIMAPINGPREYPKEEGEYRVFKVAGRLVLVRKVAEKVGANGATQEAAMQK